MLILSRKTHEQILIPGLNIRITVVSIGNNRVQLGIEAPRDIQITRPEVGRPSEALECDRRWLTLMSGKAEVGTAHK